jgi:hypothetical protein
VTWFRRCGAREPAYGVAACIGTGQVQLESLRSQATGVCPVGARGCLTPQWSSPPRRRFAVRSVTWSTRSTRSQARQRQRSAAAGLTTPGGRYQERGRRGRQRRDLRSQVFGRLRRFDARGSPRSGPLRRACWVRAPIASMGGAQPIPRALRRGHRHKTARRALGLGPTKLPRLQRCAARGRAVHAGSATRVGLRRDDYLYAPL